MADDWDAVSAPVPSARKPKKAPAMQQTSIGGIIVPTGEAHDGDTFRLSDGRNARLFGADAFELTQSGEKGGQLVPLGQQSRAALLPHLPGGIVSPTGAQTYGRPVVTLARDGEDAGRQMVSSGMAIPVPQYLAADPKRRTDYIDAQRDAIANERGAYAGTYQAPADFREQGATAPKRGKIAMTPHQASEYLALIRDPDTTPDQLSAWAQSQGQAITNAGNILSFMRRNPNAKAATYFQQADATGAAVLPNRHNVVERGLGAVNEGIADVVGFPVDAVNAAIGMTGLPASDRPILGSEWIRDQLHKLGIGQADEGYAPRSDAERYAQSFLRGVGQAAIPIGGPLAVGSRLAAAAAPVALESSAARSAIRNALLEASASPRALVAGELGANAAANISGQAADDYAPGNPYARMGAEIAGGLIGGIPAGLAFARRPQGAPRPPITTDTTAPVIGGIPLEALHASAGWDDVSAPAIAAESTGVPGSTSLLGRMVDRIDVNNRPRPMLDPATDMQRIAQAERLSPADVLPLPSNVVASQEEAASIGAGLYPVIKAPNEAAALERRALPRGDDPAREVAKRGPADLITFLRSRGGVIDQGGELGAMGIRDNASRDLDFARGEQRFGKLLDNENGMPLDQAADLAWREGYFPDHAERPTVAEFLEALDNTNRGVNRSFRSDDLAEVGAFNAARDQRLAVEKAKDQGVPLADDRGQPVTIDDLEANQPPLSAYEEWGSQAPDFAGNIRLSKLDSPQSIQRALAQSERMTGGFDAARRGRIAQAETQTLANELGMTPDQLLSRRKGQAFNAEEALAARQILAKSGNELVNMARRIQRMDDPGEEALAAFREAMVRHVAIQEQVSGATAEAGRALAQFRMTADARNVRGGVLSALAQGGGGSGRLKEAADLILENADTPQRLNRAARSAMNPKLMDKVNELWINSLLSGPATHVVNAVSNTMTALAQIPEHGVAAGIGGLRKLAGRGAVDDRVLFTEVGARSVGLLQGVKEGLRQAARTLRTGEESDFANKVEARTQEAIPGIAGKIIRTPTRLLSSADELYKGIARRMELNGLAVRQAAAEGLRGEEGKRRVAELVANPTDEMLDKAFDYGRYVTFQRPLGEGMQGISRGINATPGLKFIVPFVRTPTNLLKFAVERSPAAPLLKEWRADMQAGGARRDLALAKAMVGSGVGAVAAEMAARGMITGNGPADEKAEQLLRADGWQPYSIKIGGRYYSYSRLDPFATTLGVAAGMVELQDYMTEKQQDEVANLLTASVIQNLSSKTWLSGMSGLIEAINDPTRYADNWVERLAGSAAVPAGVAQVARTVDPTMREAEGILDAVRARVPGMSKSLAPRRDIWGEPIVSEGGLGPDLLSPARLTVRKNDPVTNELLNAGVHVSKPRHDWKKRRLSPHEYSELQALSGRIAKGRIETLIGGPVWASEDQEGRQREVSDILRDARKEAGHTLFDPPSPPDPWSGISKPARKRRSKAAVIGGIPQLPAPNASDPWAGFSEIER